MAKIPDQNAIPDPRFTSARGVEHIDAHAMGAPGRALQGLGQSIASLGAAIGANPDGMTDEQRKTQDFQTHADFLTFDIEQGDNLNAMKRDIAPDANGFRAGFAEQYDTAAREWIKGIPDRLKPKYDYMLRQRAKAYEGQARAFEDKTRDEYTIGRIGESLNGISAKMQSDPDNFNEYMERGRSLIEESPLSRHAKEKVKDVWSRQTEKGDVEQRLQRGEDPSTIMRDIQTRPMGWVPGQDGSGQGQGGDGGQGPAVNERGERIAGADGAPLGGPPTGVFPVVGVDPASVPRSGGAPNSREHMGPRAGGNHAGWDIPGPVGNPVVAVGEGTVLKVGNGQGYGHYVDVQYSDGTIHRLAHLGNIDKGGSQAPFGNDVKVGQKVSEGTVLGYLGYSGNAGREFPHVHYEIFADESAYGRSSGMSSRAGASMRINPREYFETRMASGGPNGGASNSVAAVGGDGVRALATAYSPRLGGDDTEGGYKSSKPGPDGKSEVRTLADFAAGRSKYVTLAADPSQYGKEYIIPEITFVDASGKEQTLRNVRGVVHDTGGAFKGKGAGRIDIPADKDLPDGGAGQPYSKQRIAFLPADKAPPVAQRSVTTYAGNTPAKSGDDGQRQAMAGALTAMAKGGDQTIDEVYPGAEWKDKRDQLAGMLPPGTDFSKTKLSDAAKMLQQAPAPTKTASADKVIGISADRYTPEPNESGFPQAKDRERFVLKGTPDDKARQLREIVAAGYGDVVHSLSIKGGDDVVSVKKGNPNWQTNGVAKDDAPDKIKNRLSDGEFVGPAWAKDVVAEMKSGRVTPPDGKMALGAKGVQVASLGNEGQAGMAGTAGAGEEMPDGASPPRAVNLRNGVPVAEVGHDNSVRTLLDGVPDDTKLSDLPADVREKMGDLIPKDAETPVTLPNGEKVAATDMVTVGDLKTHFSDPLRDAQREGDVSSVEAARVSVAQAQSQPWDKPIFSDAPKYRYLTEADRQILIHKAQIAQRNLFMKAGQGEVDYIKKYGAESRDEQGRTLLERAQAVMTPNQVTKLRQQIDGAKWHYQMVAPIANMPEEDIQGHLDRVAPTQADAKDLETLAMKTDAYNAAVKHAEKVRDVRRRDGALSVQGAPEVMAVWQDIRNGQKPVGTMGTGPDGKPTVPQEPAMSPVEARESLVEARLKAQERIFGDAADNRIKTITRREAEQLLRISKVDAPSEELMPLLKAAAVRADQTYGKYARRVYDDAVKMVLGANKELKEDATGVGQKLIRGENVSALDRQRFQTQKSMAPVEAFLNPQPTPKDFGSAAGSVANGLRAPQGGGAPASEFSPALALSAEQMAQAGGKMPPMKAITWLMADPEKRAGAFDQQFGAGAAKMVESTAARMMPMGGAGGEAVMMPKPKPQSKGWFGGLFGN